MWKMLPNFVLSPHIFGGQYNNFFFSWLYIVSWMSTMAVALIYQGFFFNQCSGWLYRWMGTTNIFSNLEAEGVPNSSVSKHLQYKITHTVHKRLTFLCTHSNQIGECNPTRQCTVYGQLHWVCKWRVMGDPVSKHKSEIGGQNEMLVSHQLGQGLH